MRQLLAVPGVIDEEVPPELTIIAVSLWLIVFLGLTSVVYRLVFMWKENRFGWPLRGIFWFTVAIIGSCAFIGLLAGSEQTARSLERVSHLLPL
jgi:hypothetical protein